MDGNIRLSATVISCMGKDSDKDDFYFNGNFSNCHNTESIQCSFDKSLNNYIFAISDSMGIDTEEMTGVSAIKEIKKHHENSKKQQFSLEYISEKVYESVQLTSNLIYSKSAISNIQDSSILTGFSSVIIDNNRATVMNLGNNGSFLYRQGVQSELFTHNDSKKNQKLKMLGISPNTNDIFNDTEKILKLAEEESKTKIKVSSCIELEEGDIFLICSDGLLNSTNKSRIESVVNSGLETSKMANILFQEALKKGIEDSQTIMIIRVDEIKNIEYSSGNYRRYSQMDYDNEIEEVHPKKEKSIVNYILAFVCILVISGILFMGYLIIQNSNILSSEKEPGKNAQTSSTTNIGDSSDSTTLDDITNSAGQSDSAAESDSQAKTNTSEQNNKNNSSSQDSNTNNDKETDTITSDDKTSTDNKTDPSKQDSETESGNDTKTEDSSNISQNTEYDIHIVKSGETLSSISYKYYADYNKYDDIIKFNNLKDENSLYIDQELKIPKLKK